ncbi:MAG: class I SAM-dependent methyltransferase [Candidatus Auribacterota bacterium]
MGRELHKSILKNYLDRYVKKARKLLRGIEDTNMESLEAQFNRFVAYRTKVLNSHLLLTTAFIQKWVQKLNEEFVKLENGVAEHFFQLSALDESFLKSRIRSVENKEFRKILMRYYFYQFKETLINNAMENKLVTLQTKIDRSASLGKDMDERIIEIPLALEVAQLDHEGWVLDAGSALNFEFVRRLVPNQSASLIHFTQSANKEEMHPSNDRISYVFGDLRDLPFRDNQFNQILCISTIEHVGCDNSRYGASVETDSSSYLLAVKEMYRVLKPGGRLLLTFPYGKKQDFGWYHVLDKDETAAMIEQCQGASVQEKYYYYDSLWYEESADHEKHIKPETGVTNALAVLVLTKPKSQKVISKSV